MDQLELITKQAALMVKQSNERMAGVLDGTMDVEIIDRTQEECKLQIKMLSALIRAMGKQKEKELAEQIKMLNNSIHALEKWRENVE